MPLPLIRYDAPEGLKNIMSFSMDRRVSRSGLAKPRQSPCNTAGIIRLRGDMQRFCGRLA